MPIYKNKNGTYTVKINYKDEYGQYKQILRSNKFTRTKAEAKLYEANLLKEITSNTLSEDNDITFEKLCNDYFLFYNNSLRSSTLRQTKNALKNHILPYFKDKKIKGITAKDIMNWKIKLQKEPYTITYLNNLYKCFSKVINFGMEYYNLQINNVKKAKRFTDSNVIEDEEGAIQFWTKEEFMFFYDTIKNKINDSKDFYTKLNLSNYLTFFCILFFCGTRKGEAYCLTWKKILKDSNVNKLFKINESMNQKVSPYEITGPKNKSSYRKIPICNFLQKQLDDHLALYKQVYLFKDSWFICGGLEPMHDTSIDNFKNKYALQLSLPKIRVHDFRHSFASLLINGNINIKTISKLMGHANVEQTWNRYGHLYPEAENEAIAYIDKIIM